MISVGLIAAMLAAGGASVGMLATVAERFRSGEDRDGVSRAAPEPSSQGKRALLRNVTACDERAVAQWNGRRREGDGADRKPVERSNRALVTAQLMIRAFRIGLILSEQWISPSLVGAQVNC